MDRNPTTRKICYVSLPQRTRLRTHLEIKAQEDGIRKAPTTLWDSNPQSLDHDVHALPQCRNQWLVG